MTKDYYNAQQAGHRRLMAQQAQEEPAAEWREGEGYHNYREPDPGEYSPYDLQAWLADHLAQQREAIQAEVQRGYFGQKRPDVIEGKWR